MKKIEIYNQKLIRFADHLYTMKKYPGQIPIEIELVNLGVKTRKHQKMIYDYIIIDELPAVWDAFYYNEINGDVTLEGYNPEESPLAGIIDFFGLSLEEFVHVFSIGDQNTMIFGGHIVNENSKPKDVAMNIYDFVRRRRY